MQGNSSAEALLAAKSEAADGLIATASEEFLAGAPKTKIAVCAVGGYGRRELFPFSDVDLVLLFDAEPDIGGSKEAISRFMSELWDRGLRASHSVRTVAECAELHEQNIELHISLLDVRFVHGNKQLYDALADRLSIFNRRQGTLLTKYLAEMTRHRHAKFNNTIYHLEPNIKEAPGGVRDIHVLRWLGQLAPEHRVEDSAQRLKGETAFLFRVRCFLHLSTGRDNNLLSYEMQDEAASFLPETALSPEEWMRLYFQSARSIYQKTSLTLEAVESSDPTLLRQFREWRGRLSTSEFTVSRERVFLRNAAETLSSPQSIFQLFTFVGRHGVQLSWDTHRRLENELKGMTALFEKAPPRWPQWRDLFA
ncbi:MAG TPA: hypothetical protein VFA65_19370, partial [Bryobacteraceae bacterium]|nr:hypothetical protein [Bryobacteraceae bacterium]